MQANYAKSLAAVLTHEGGFVNHPRDPGGATNKGVTQKVYDRYRLGQHLPLRSVKDISNVEVAAIYRTQYWDKIEGDLLPSGVDYAVFDFAVNSGVSRASKFLQRVLGIAPDGIIGNMTVTMSNSNLMPPGEQIDHLCDDRQAFLESLDTFDTFGKGWTRRVKEVRAAAKALVK